MRSKPPRPALAAVVAPGCSKASMRAASIRSPSAKTSRRSITLRSSRTLPGQAWSIRRCRASGSTRGAGVPGWRRTAWRNRCSTSSGMSSRRSRSGGTTIWTTSSRYSRSWRKRPSPTSASRSRWVAAITRAPVRRTALAPSGRNSPLSSTRSSLAWQASGSSPISSRKRLPALASSNRPSRSALAPVKAPRLWPKSSLSTSSPSSRPQLTGT